ncbi:TonB-dependent receptor [Pontixanthobacter aquaemixtae]|uniref:TonB-dependent receptor n=1 Tax=Pontixanthobacter aquaemixtae TaxID=1958940 RepID=A0A844ZSA2_9SPHN|nr:TonB-dependent receptor [Pontixanthobacter aquaemixtae]MXO90374.1 TonB-dependent receptor [Pontixanthobacter aquaemixtae]
MRFEFIKKAALTGASLFAISCPVAAIAQDTGETAAEDDNTIVVTGFRQSLDEALDTKREATGVVDVIVAEDIADFPDLNLAESLQRIPGVAIDRQAGEGRRITVRGLGGTFTRVRVNGLEALSTSGGSDASGGTNRSRAFDFNVFASELFNELAVRKTQSAEIEEGSLGANVELRTGRPFDYGAGLTGALSAQAQYNDLAEDLGPRVAGLLSYTNDDETFGALLSVAFQDRLIREEGFSTVRFDDFATFRSALGQNCAGNPTGGACEELRNAWYARIPRYGRLDYDQQRLGITGSLQFRPGDNTTISFDGLYSDFKGDRSEEFLEVFIRSNTDNLDVTDYTINGDGVITRLVADIQADAANGIIPVRSEHRRDKLNTEYFQITGELEHEFTDTFRLNVLGGISRSDLSIPQQATIFFDAATPVSGYSYDFTNSFNTPDISFGNFDVTDPSSFLFTQYRNRPQGVDNSYDTFQPNLEWEVSPSLTLKTGFSYKRFKFETFEGRAEGDVSDITGTGPIAVDASLANLLSGYGSGLGLPAGTDRTWVTPNFDAAVNAINLFSIPPVVRAQDTRSVVETDYGGFVQADFDLTLGDMPVRGDFGVRFVETNVSSTGFVNGTDEVTIDRSYDDWLPAFNVVLEPTPDLLIRGGIAKVMARPELGDLTPGGSIDTFNGPPFNFSLGNPGLDPFRAWTYDISIEWYFQPEALLALALFQKDISSFFQQADTIETTFSQTGLPNSVASPTSPLAQLLSAGQDPRVDINQQVNGDDAKVKGLEVIFQTPFTFLGSGLDNFGFVGNYTYVNSDDIIGFSPNSFNATLYYEDEKFAARVTGAYRDAYLTRLPNASGRTEGRESRGVGSTFNLDFSASYQLTDQVEVTFEAINLTDEFEFQTFDVLNLPTLYHHTGRNFLLGARYSF